MTALYIILGIILFFIIVFAIPVRVTADYNDSFKLYLSYLFIKISIFPKKEKKKKVKKEKTDKKDDSEENITDKTKPKEKKDNLFLKFYKNQGFDATLELIKDALNAISGFFGGVFRHFVFREMYLELRVSGSDAASTAIKYGKISEGIFPAMGLICSKARVKKYDIDISPDYLAVKDKARFYFKFSISPIFITNALVVVAIRLLKDVLLKLKKVESDDNSRNRKIEKKVKKVVKENKS